MRIRLTVGISFALFLLLPCTVQAQWVKTNGLCEHVGNVISVATNGSNIFAGTCDCGGLNLPTDDGTTFAPNGSNHFAGRGNGGSIYLSTDNGATWTMLDMGVAAPIPPGSIRTLVTSPNGTGGIKLFAGVSSGVIAADFRGNNGVHLSTDNGLNWIRLIAGQVSAIVVSGTNVLAGTEDGKGVLFSTDNGTNWTKVDSGLTNQIVSSLAVMGPNVFAGTYDGVFVTTDTGRSWAPVSVGLTDRMVRALISSGTNLFAGTQSGGVFLSDDGGNHWTAINPGVTRSSVTSFVVSGQNLFAGTSGEGVFLTTDSGKSWTAVNSGLTDNFVECFAVSGPNLFAGAGCSVWKRPLSEMTVSVMPMTGIPVQFGLGQNYPNPFNPSTVIRYSLPQAVHVTVNVYDVLGRGVSNLVDKYEHAGEKRVTFSAGYLPGGVYFYRLQAGSFTETKKLILIR